jgi:hypothetical protein
VTGPGFDPPDLEKRLAFNVRVNELLGRAVTQAELLNVRLCYAMNWTPENTATAIERLATEPVEKPAHAGEAGWNPGGD